MFDFVRMRKWVFAITVLMLVLAVVFLMAPPRLPLGLEFSSGSSVTVTFQEPVKAEDVRAKLESIGLEKPSVQITGDREAFIRTEFVKEGIGPILEERFGKVTTQSLERRTDLAVDVSFPYGAEPEDLRAYFGVTPPGSLEVLAQDGGNIFMSARSLPEARLSAVLQAWQDRYGPLTRVDFSGAGDLAVVLRFKSPVAASDVRQEIASRSIAGVSATRILDNEVLLTAKDFAEANREPLLTALKDRFGEFEQAPFNFEEGKAFVLRFTRPVNLDRLFAELAVVPAAQAVGERAAVFPIGNATTLLVSKEMTADQAQALQAAIEAKVGRVEAARLQPQDLALAMNFGPSVSLAAFNSEVTGLSLPGVITESFSPSVFIAVSENLTEQQKADLLSRLESRFGLSKRTTYDTAADVAVTLEFSNPVDRTEMANVLSQGGLEGALVINIGGNRYFVGAKNATPDIRDQALGKVIERFGQYQRREFDHTEGLAMQLDYGPTVTLNSLRRGLIALGIQGVTVTPDGQDTFLLAGKGLAANRQSAILGQIEDQFGLARRTAFDFTNGQILTVKPTELGRFRDAVLTRFVVQDNGDQTYFLGAVRVTPSEQELVFSSLGQAFGRVVQRPLNFSANIATFMRFDKPVTPDEVAGHLKNVGYANLTVDQRLDGSLFIRGTRPGEDQRSRILSALEAVAPLDRSSVEFDSVDAEIAKRSITNTVWAILASSVAILLYVWYAFRKVQRPFRYGATAVMALLHDVAIILGVLGLLAKFSNVEFNSLTIVGILAIIGYSVNNTIVMFDRVRENVSRHPGRPFDLAVNISLNETLTRNINTALTTIVAILAVILFGGDTIRDFMVVLLTGVVAGVYNAQFLAANLLVAWEKGELRVPFLSRSRRTAA